MQMEPLMPGAKRSQPAPYKKERALSGSRSSRPFPTNIEVGVAQAIGDVLPDKNQPYLANMGGEHIITMFDDPEHSQVVYKVNYRETGTNLSVDWDDPAAREKGMENMRERMQHRRDHLTNVREYFGFDAVPAEVLMVRDIPVTQDLVNKVLPSLASTLTKLPEQVPGWVVVQRKLDLDPKSTVSLNGGYPEHPGKLFDTQGDPKTEAYDQAHDILTGRTKTPSQQLAWAAATEMYPELMPVINRVMSDTAFSKSLKETVQRLLDYTNETRNAFDLNGRNNLVLMEKDGEWKLKMPDVVFSESTTLGHLEEAIKKLHLGDALNRRYVIFAVNTLNTVRYINALAIVAGLPGRVEVAGLTTIPPAEWRKGIAQLFPVHSRKQLEGTVPPPRRG